MQVEMSEQITSITPDSSVDSTVATSRDAKTASTSLPIVAATPAPYTRAGRHGKILLAAVQVAIILLGACAVTWILRRVVGDDLPQTNWLLTALLAGAALAAGCWGAFTRWYHFMQPIRKLQLMIPQVRSGRCPIEELSTIEGGLAPLIPQIQQLMRDLRLERTRIAALEHETRLRVMTRTESLERKIGSLQQQATRDGLTTLYNRRSLDQQLPALIEQCRQQADDLSVLMIDVDYFKTLNDTLGHAAGDQLLKQIAQLIRSTIRADDSAYRCGGDEFVVVLPGATFEVAASLADRLRSLVDGLAKTLKVSRAPRLSIGVASLISSNVASAPELLALADKALYEVKSARPGSSRVA